MNGIEWIAGLYGRLLHALGLVAALATFVMMALVVLNALTRFALNAPIAGTLEITESLLPIMIFLSMALTQLHGGHIHVVMLTRRFPPAWARAARAGAALLGAAFFAWCAWSAWRFAAQSYAIGEQEWGSISFPLYPIKFIVFLGVTLLAIQFLFSAALALRGYVQDDEPTLAGN